MFIITQGGKSALMIAAKRGETEVVSLLLAAGADFHLQNEVWMLTGYVRGGVVWEEVCISEWPINLRT